MSNKKFNMKKKMKIENTYFWKNWLFIVGKFKEIRDMNKGEFLEDLGFDTTADYNWKDRKRVADTSLRRIVLYVNRELGWNITKQDLLNRDLSSAETGLRLSDIKEEYLIKREKEILRIFRNAAPEQQDEILNYLRYLSTKKG